MSASSDERSNFSEGFLFLRLGATIVCASATARGMCGRDVYGCVGRAGERYPTMSRKFIDHHCAKISALLVAHSCDARWGSAGGRCSKQWGTSQGIRPWRVRKSSSGTSATQGRSLSDPRGHRCGTQRLWYSTFYRSVGHERCDLHGLIHNTGRSNVHIYII